MIYLDETNVGGLLTEALTADDEAVLPDQTSLVRADAAIQQISRQSSAKSKKHPDKGRPWIRFHIPLTAALTVGAGARVEDRLVRHVGLGVVKLFVDEVVGKGTAAARW